MAKNITKRRARVSDYAFLTFIAGATVLMMSADLTGFWAIARIAYLGFSFAFLGILAVLWFLFRGVEPRGEPLEVPKYNWWIVFVTVLVNSLISVAAPSWFRIGFVVACGVASVPYFLEDWRSRAKRRVRRRYLLEDWKNQRAELKSTGRAA